MAVRVGINGFGRIGRSFTRAILARGEQADVELVAVNDPFGDAHTMAFLLKHDSVGRTLAERGQARPTTASRSTAARSRSSRRREPAEIPWGDNGVDVVIESTGLFTAREKAAGHLKGGAKRVVISAPSGDADAMICMGVNDERLRRRGAHRHLERVVHHQLPRADGAVLHDRSASSRASSTRCTRTRATSSSQDQAAATRSGKPDLRRMRAAGAVDHPEHHRRGAGDRPGPARAQGQARRHVAARARRRPVRSPTSSRC